MIIFKFVYKREKPNWSKAPRRDRRIKGRLKDAGKKAKMSSSPNVELMRMLCSCSGGTAWVTGHWSNSQRHIYEDFRPRSKCSRSASEKWSSQKVRKYSFVSGGTGRGAPLAEIRGTISAPTVQHRPFGHTRGSSNSPTSCIFFNQFSKLCLLWLNPNERD